MFCWEMCGEERDLVARGNGVYGGGGPRVATVEAVVTVVVVVGVTAELRGRTMGGEDGVKRKGRLGIAAAVPEDARLRVWVPWPDEDEDARLRIVVGEVLRREWEMPVVVVVKKVVVVVRWSGPAGLG
jgi:hypothetical protein